MRLNLDNDRTRAGSVPAAGDLAPDFTLASTAGDRVTLSSFRGSQNVLIAFFPLAFTSTCTAELCDLGNDWDQFRELNVKVLPISVDSVDSLREYRNKHSMPFELLSDFKRHVSRSYGVLLEDRFYSNRAYVLVDQPGVIRWMHVEVHPGLKRHNRELLERIIAIA